MKRKPPRFAQKVLLPPSAALHPTRWLADRVIQFLSTALSHLETASVAECLAPFILGRELMTTPSGSGLDLAGRQNQN